MAQFSRKSTDDVHEFDSMRQKYNDAMANNERMARHLDTCNARVAQLNGENDNLRRSWKAKVDYSDEWRNRACVREAEKDRIQEELDRMAKKKDHFVETARRARNEANSAIWDLADLQRTHAETTALLEARTKKLAAAHWQFVIVTGTESISAGDVVKLTGKLNAEISQCAASLADRLPTQREASALNSSESPSVENTAAAFWEQNGVNKLLEVARKVDDPMMAIQTAMQACLVSVSAHVINLWYPGAHDNASMEGMFQGLYDILRQTGRWFP
jgi:hypothetical protein